jgi:hypothetical protein
VHVLSNPNPVVPARFPQAPPSGAAPGATWQDASGDAWRQARGLVPDPTTDGASSPPRRRHAHVAPPERTWWVGWKSRRLAENLHTGLAKTAATISFRDRSGSAGPRWREERAAWRRGGRR